jgi:hypothetical protein
MKIWNRKLVKICKILKKQLWKSGNEKLNKSNKNTFEILTIKLYQVKERLSGCDDKVDILKPVGGWRAKEEHDQYRGRILSENIICMYGKLQ